MSASGAAAEPYWMDQLAAYVEAHDVRALELPRAEA